MLTLVPHGWLTNNAVDEPLVNLQNVTASVGYQHEVGQNNCLLSTNAWLDKT